MPGGGIECAGDLGCGSGNRRPGAPGVVLAGAGEAEHIALAGPAQGHRLLELIRKMTLFLTHSTPSRSPRSLPKVSTNPGEAHRRPPPAPRPRDRAACKPNRQCGFHLARP